MDTIESGILIAHIGGGVAGILTGLTALFTRKGAAVHRAAGNIFFAAMLINAATASYLGYAHEDNSDVVGGIMTIYLVSTAWMTVRRREGETGLFERGAFLFAATGAAVGAILTWQAARAGTAIGGGLPGYLFSAVVALAAAFDLRMILYGGISGRQRVARHLWRMHLGFFIAVGSFFPGQIHLFPEFIRNTKPEFLLFLPALSIIALMLFWVARVLLTGSYRQAPPVA